MSATLRDATPEDALFLVHVIDMASDGLLPAIWARTAPAGMDGPAFGQAMVTAEDGDFSYRNAVVIEQDGTAIGGLIGYPLPAKPEPVGPEVPEVFVPIQELANDVPGHWYINVVAVDRVAREKGCGTALLKEAEARARASGCPGLALIVAASNTAAIEVYQRAGYKERARRPFDMSDFGADPTDALLMVKDLAPSSG